MSVKALLSLWVIDPEGRSYQRGAVKPIVLPILSLTCSDPINRGKKVHAIFSVGRITKSHYQPTAQWLTYVKQASLVSHRSIFQNEIQNQP